MKKLYFYFLTIIVFSILAYSVTEEQTLLASVLVNPAPGILDSSPNNLLVNAPPLSQVEKNLTFFQENDNQNLNISLFLEISEINTWVSFSENNFIVKPNETKDITAFINIPNITARTYSGNIHALTTTQDLVIPINITVTDKYRIGVNIDVIQRKINAGKNISIFTELTKTKQRRQDLNVEGKINVNLVYNVLKGKDLVTTLSTTIDVVDYNADTILISIPINATNGEYTAEVTVTHLDKTATDKDNFQVTTNLFGIFSNFLKRFI